MGAIYVPPAVTQANLQRRPVAERAAAFYMALCYFSVPLSRTGPVQQVSRGPDLGRAIGMQHKQDLSIGRELGEAVRQVVERVRDLAERVVERFRELERYRGLER